MPQPFSSEWQVAEGAPFREASEGGEPVHHHHACGEGDEEEGPGEEAGFLRHASEAAQASSAQASSVEAPCCHHASQEGGEEKGPGEEGPEAGYHRHA